MTTEGTAPGDGRTPGDAGAPGQGATDGGRAPGQGTAEDGNPPTGGPLRAWADRTSCVQGGDLAFHLTGAAGAAVRVTVTEAIGEQVRLTATVHAPDWTLTVPEEWPSSLYRATFDVPEENRPTTCEAEHEVWFAVRAARPGATSRILVPIPFATWRAYTHAGQPHRGLYYAEQPYRAARVSFASPGGGPPPSAGRRGCCAGSPAPATRWTSAPASTCTTAANSSPITACWW